MLRVPRVHLNGTAAEDLERQVEEAARAVDTALEKLAAANPNGRDYYVQGDDALREAQEQHRSRVERLTTVRNELRLIYEGLADQRKP